MKKIIRRLFIDKLPKIYYEHIPKQYLVVYRNDYDLLSKKELDYLLLHPKKGKDIEFIFNWEDKIEIKTIFEEVGE